MKTGTKTKKIVGLTLAAVLTVSGAGVFAGCKKKDNTTYYDNDKDALIFSTQEVDGVFNPFYSTSATDSNVVGMTQLGMISNDKEGNYAYGDNEATVVKDLEISDNGKAQDNGLQTTYKFVLKSGLKFSDGSPLTMKDVLFNLYEYLDPAYSGSSTIYSTDIVGLKAYRTQSDNESEQDNFEKKYQTIASGRVGALVDASEAVFDADKNDEIDTSQKMKEALQDYMDTIKASQPTVDTYDHIVEDYEKAVELFREELESDWSNSLDSYEDLIFTDNEGTNHKNLFTTDVEVFLYNENYITWDKKAADFSFTFASNLAEIKAHGSDADKGKSWAIEQIISDKIPSDISEIVQYWATASTLTEYIAKAVMESDFAGKELMFDHIEGIQFANRTQSVAVNGVDYAVPTYNDDGSVKSGNEVLSITINNVDPKAIWNFSFAVAPMYYYSNSAQIAAFDYESHFGVEYNSQTFQNSVIKNVNKIGVPVGAGPYMAAKSSGGTQNVGSGDFRANGVIYFEANPNYIMGKPLIQKVRYQVVSTSQMTNSLYSGGVHFCEPTAKPETVTELNNKKSDGIASESVRTAGYGYIGVNAAKVPSLYVRQAIMHSVDTSLVVKYYGTTATAIFRSMSLANWAYPTGATSYYPYIGDPIPENLENVNPNYKAYVERIGRKAGEKMSPAEQSGFIAYLVEDLGGYALINGVYKKSNSVLKYDFTIAGAETDHPAWNAMYQAGTFLNNNGFQINVRTDANALKKLSTGDLAVWAAAWGSTIDPDMYQVYHKDSTASSTKNWGYDAIKNNTGSDRDTREAEQAILNELAEYIENARATNDQDQRKRLYKEALDLVMQLAVELPTYQRDDLFAYNSKFIDKSSLNPDPSPYKGLTSDIHTVSLVVEK